MQALGGRGRGRGKAGKKRARGKASASSIAVDRASKVGGSAFAGGRIEAAKVRRAPHRISCVSTHSLRATGTSPCFTTHPLQLSLTICTPLVRTPHPPLVVQRMLLKSFAEFDATGTPHSTHYRASRAAPPSVVGGGPSRRPQFAFRRAAPPSHVPLL